MMHTGAPCHRTEYHENRLLDLFHGPSVVHIQKAFLCPPPPHTDGNPLSVPGGTPSVIVEYGLRYQQMDEYFHWELAGGAAC